MYNFRKKYEFPWRSPGRNLYNISSIFGCFFVIKHQSTGVMHKSDVLYTTCSPRLKIVHIYQKMFFGNFAHFLQNNETVRGLMLRVMFVIFMKMPNFFLGGYVGKNYPFFTNFDLFFCCVSSINRVNGQKLRGVATLVTEGENCNILSENFFENFAHVL